MTYANPHKSDLSANAHKNVECPMCRGRGYRGERKCRLCGGDGAIDEQLAAEWVPES
jgi:DnaJ-class molecular chaperone